VNDAHLGELTSAVDGILRGRRERPPFEFDRDLWSALAGSGFTLLPVAESAGGSGGTLQDAVAVTAAAVRHGAGLPLGESMMLGAWLLESAGLPVPRHDVLTAVASSQVSHAPAPGGSLRVSGRLTAVPWARHSSWLVMLIPGRPGYVTAAVRLGDGDGARGVSVEHGENLAGDARDGVVLDSAVVEEGMWARSSALSPPDVRARGALVRLAESSGACQAVLEATCRHVAEREQFGRPLIRFQVVQERLAQLAGETAAVTVAAQAAALAQEDGSAAARAAVAAAKAAAGESVTAVTRIAHQLHGAIGTTREHPLGGWTTRLWAWQDEYGSDARWQAELGALAAGDTDPWDLVTGETGPAEAL
jgi:acyl-CoA dehydrogenase